MSSLQNINGGSTGDFALKDVFGVSFAGQYSKLWNYLAPTDGGEMISNDVACPLVVETTAKRLASVAEPLFDYDDLEHFASYHSNPPGPPGKHAALTVNQFGKGKCIYLYSGILGKQLHAHQVFGEALFKKFAASSIIHECNAPPTVEVTVLRGTRKPSYLLCFVNYQEESPIIPIQDIKITVTLPNGAVAANARLVSAGQSVQFQRDGERLSFHLPKLSHVEMIEIEPRESKS